MRKIILMFILSLMAMNLLSQEYRKDTAAVIILDRMSKIIGDMGSVSFSLDVAYDVIDVELGLVKYFMKHEVYMVGPDKMLVHSRGQKGHRSLSYNGSQLMYYSFTENNYAVIDAPGNIIATIDTVNRTYGIDFPAADFFYPTFTDDLIQDFDDIIYDGLCVLDGKECYHIIAKNQMMGLQVWVANDEWFLPVKFVFVYYDQSPNQQYEGFFSNWDINPELPPAMFEFTPPPNAVKLTMVSRQDQ